MNDILKGDKSEKLMLYNTLISHVCYCATCATTAVLISLNLLRTVNQMHFRNTKCVILQTSCWMKEGLRQPRPCTQRSGEFSLKLRLDPLV